MPAPPPEDVKYVGISRAFDERCSKHPVERRPSIRRLNLPPLVFQEARSVEEALIAHFGTTGELPNNRFGSRGQLDNIVHSIDPDRPSYCVRLVLGQMMLLENGYGSYAAAHYTRSKVCAGVGGPR
ncbi:MAG TPA: hypothetical protein VFG42_24080 [Baekduia sp.]|uniref:hypothetical protein n=1 Tax=Baekduia sp. TaxID=2600305 RepID=UPI002D773250|nr:hypothetical protein [Baekduia sp.]HET6509893.1 hypothetical protein [Baekduia sp.]